MLRQRNDAPLGYYEAEVGDKKYSVVDFGTTMKNYPFAVFLGWEAIEIGEDGHLLTEKIDRADSWDELLRRLAGI